MRIDGTDIDLSHIDMSHGVAAFDAAMDDLREETLQIPPFLEPHAWIEQHMELPKGKTSRPGPLKLTGYQRPVASAFLDATVSQITILKGAQVGWSVFLSALVAYGLGYLGIPVTLAQPTDDDAKSYYKDRIEPLFRSVDALKRIRRHAARGEVQDTWNEHHFLNSATLRLVGAFSDDAFRRYSSKWNLGDEYTAKGWSKSKGSQGEKADLFRARGTDFIDSILALGSTPLSRDECRTYAEWLKSDQSIPFVTCPHCGHLQNLKWGDRESAHGFKWMTDENGGVVECWYQCESERGCRIDELHKEDMVEGVEFISQAIPKRPGHRGFHWPQWLSSAPQANWRNLAQAFLAAKGDAEAMKVWINNVKADVWDDFTASAVDSNTVTESIRDYPAEVPDDVVLLTAGGDTQTNKEGSHLEELASREIQVVGWTRQKQFRIIGHWTVEGPPGDPEADARVDELLTRGFRKRDGTVLRIEATAIDLGGTFSDETRAFCAQPARKRRNIWAIKGRNNSKGSRMGTVWPRKVSRSKKGGAQFYTIDSQLARDSIFRLMQMRGDAGPMIPRSMPADFYEKLMCEERKRINGGWYWQPKKSGRAEEEWICLAYAYAALCGLQASYVKWRDLNLAAARLGVSAVAHDPETGEIDYDGPDRSAMAAPVEEPAKDISAPVRSTAAARPMREQRVNAPARPTAADSAGGEELRQKPVRKKRRGGLHW